MSRQRVLRRARRQFVFLIEEAAPHYRLYETHVLVEQLARLEDVTRLPTISRNHPAHRVSYFGTRGAGGGLQHFRRQAGPGRAGFW
ncbi:Scr1 family TA system antitoxin-like transcriptional regulator [Nonomuraea candida]|uniref:Scr1 family TA system antitoxin-like transcriptional regulator n=1 Tax=Nonomuraea candida TaxID=359159 RepID=UPI0034E0DA01